MPTGSAADQWVALIDEEAADDSATCDQMVGWSETDDEAKNAAIAEAETKVEELMSKVEARSGRDEEVQTKMEHIFRGLAEVDAHFGHCRPREGACRLPHETMLWYTTPLR